MVIGTVFTLFVVPAIYVLVARSRKAVAAAATSSREPDGAGARPGHGLT